MSYVIAHKSRRWFLTGSSVTDNWQRARIYPSYDAARAELRTLPTNQQAYWELLPTYDEN